MPNNPGSTPESLTFNESTVSYAPEAGSMRSTSPSRVVHQSMSSGPHVSSHGMLTPETRSYSLSTVSPTFHVGWAKAVKAHVADSAIKAKA